ncbi:EamA family transporter [Sneathiella sp. P13V-1]|uniref:DMT family transporter n=1 Tax=Sneathiella sp. P13V-1 TaxID=2697366 RepID=UPI00187B77B9|nr:DMT family transporter [Sneathiella sp. P13V-1]MBE7635878.1 EamA family transporter [Sneathiella sp. P13V-1]
MQDNNIARAISLTTLAMLAFAANSVLCRLALADSTIDAASFTAVRTLSGAIILLVLFSFSAQARKTPAPFKPRIFQIISLIGYMVFFSFAYNTLAAGTGALILFGAVQITMFMIALKQGEHFPPLAWAGLVLAIGGLVYLVSPGLSAPDPVGAVLMAIAGVSWGVYSLLGRGTGNPLQSTMSNFLYAAPVTILLVLIMMEDLHVTPFGMIMAILSGALASGCGYAIWYAALKGLTASRAATVQLTVPAIAAIGGAFLLSEDITFRLAIAGIVTLGGVGIVLSQKMKA